MKKPQNNNNSSGGGGNSFFHWSFLQSLSRSLPLIKLFEYIYIYIYIYILRVSFWRDRWCGDAPLSESFPSLYALSIEKEAWVADVWDPLVQGGRGGWNPCFSRALNDWEVEEAELFLGCLHGKRVLGDVDDKAVWTETKSGIFSAKSLYLALEADCPSSFPSSCI